MAASIDAIVCGGGVLLAVRRVTADWHPPHGPAVLVAVCVAGGLLIAAGDVARRGCGQLPGWLARLGLIIAAVAVAIPLPATTVGQGVMAVAALVGAGLVTVRPWLPRRSVRIRRSPGRVSPPVLEESGVMNRPTLDRPPGAPFPPATAPAEVPGQFLQQFTRFTRADGVECVHGRLSLAVPAGVRSAAGHIGFCPPFPHTPSVEVTTDYDAVEAMVTAAEVLPWGVRIECRLDEPADAAFEIPIDIIAEAGPIGSST